jgi:serine/threonine protein kinase
MGCILYELCALKLPFEGPNIIMLVQKIVRDPLPSIPRGYSEFVRQLFGEMLNRSPRMRPSAGTILKRPRIQCVIKDMVDQASAAQDLIKAQGAIRYTNGQLVDYYSQSHGAWIQAVVACVDEDGGVEVDVKPGMRIPLDQLAQRLRPHAGDAKQIKDGDRPRPISSESEHRPIVGISKVNFAGDPEFAKLCEELGIDQDVADADSFDQSCAPHHLVTSVPEIPEGDEIDIADDLLQAGEEALNQLSTSCVSSCSLTVAEKLLAEVDS